ncbi:MAG: iron-containing alcohol dehydrogenase [Verrucomicrobiales bacterium]
MTQPRTSDRAHRHRCDPAVEAAVLRPPPSSYAKLAFRLLDSALEIVLNEPSNLEARARMQLGAAYAGTAIENSMLGAAHSCANPLTTAPDVVHSEGGQRVSTSKRGGPGGGGDLCGPL